MKQHWHQLKQYLGWGDLSADELMRRYGDDAYLLTVHGQPVRIKESGQGEPLVLLHGFSASADTWDGWREQLSDRYRVIALDVPPFAVTGPLLSGPTTPLACVHFLHDVFAKLGLKEFYLAGNSLGGYLAWSYALHYPQQVRKLVLVDSVGYAHRAPLPVMLYRLPVVARVTSQIAPLPVIANSIRSAYGHRQRAQGAHVHRYQSLLRRQGSRQAIAEMMQPSLYVDHEQIRQLRLPTLILWGKLDRWIPPAHAYRFQQDIPHSQLICYDDLGHIPMEEDPVRTAVDVRRFLVG